MTLYQQIILLKHYCKGSWVVENVRPYYKPLMPAVKLGRHLVWSNLDLEDTPTQKDCGFISKSAVQLEGRYGFYLADVPFKGVRKSTILRNLVNPEIGEYILSRVNI
jgi:DNA (cytosine-5)-methyltransferase 1